MQRRKTRKGYWWWSWLVAIFAAGGTIGGWFVGESLWKKSPKNYISSALIKVDIIPTYVEAGAREQMVDGLLNAEEVEILASLKSVHFLTMLATSANLWERWGVEENEGLKRLRKSLQFNLNKDKELIVDVSRSTPEDALELAKTTAETTLWGLQQLAELRKVEGLRLMKEDLAGIKREVDDSTAELAAVLKRTGAPIEPKEGMNLDDFAFVEGVVEAKVVWETALADLKVKKKELLPMKLHWERKVKEPILLEEPQLPTRISFSQKEDYQTQGAVAGVSVGIVLGLLAMLVCWKIFS
ncbi:MAG: hypothetical protein OSA93_00180 [Akkermansiaceae bacterium]|nr:hypothetical protein [Akkermansiaceae bacterium]